jgi:phosphoenolpyruvate carboxykinase (GTP)
MPFGKSGAAVIQVDEKKLTTNPHVIAWVKEMAELCKPDRIHWCDGSEHEKKALIGQAVEAGELLPLDHAKYPGSYYHRTAENDVARTENLTFICSRKKEDAGPTNNWMDPKEAYQKLAGIFDGSMKGRTLYVVPFIMGPAKSPFSKVGVQITDSLYVTLSMGVMTRMGKAALDQLGASSNDFTRCLHGKADVNIARRFICHFPEDNTVWSVGSAYGGNALLGKKCLSLRIGSFLGKTQGWMAEHMLILGVENPKGEISYIAAAFPSQCGKTNLAMLQPPAALEGYRIWTVGDDIAWLRIGPDGRLWAVNPEYGMFGVVPGTNMKTNPTAMKMIQSNTVFTNVVYNPKDRSVWWEGLSDPPHGALDWKGKPWDPASGEKGAHPNSRFTVPAAQCPTISPKWEDPAGVPLSAILFGGRRAKLAPLVYEAFNWQHGAFVGATMASETTAAATAQVGVVRRDPMAMLPFCGYHVGDYFRHWIEMGKKIPKPPKIFHVNWFRTDAQGKFMWPGFGDNLRVLLWVLERAQGKGQAQKTPIGYVPTPKALDLAGLDLSDETIANLLSVNRSEWEAELKDLDAFFETVGERLPKELRAEEASLRERLKTA